MARDNTASAQATPVQQNALQAIALMMSSVFFLSTMDVVIKLLVEHYPSLQVVFLRCAFSFPLFAGWILLVDRRQFRTQFPRAHLLRGLIGIVMLYTVGECFREMQLADAYVIFFAAPLIVTLLSGPVLGEPAGRVRSLAALVGFAGVLFVLQPSGGGWISYGALMGCIGTLGYVATILLLRKLGSGDSTLTIAFWFVTICGLGAGLLAWPNWQTIDWDHWPLFAVLGVSGTAGQVLLTAAFRRASVAVIAPFDYVHMLWAVVFGWTIWGYLPGWNVAVGAGIIIASGLVIVYRERRLSGPTAS